MRVIAAKLLRSVRTPTALSALVGAALLAACSEGTPVSVAPTAKGPEQLTAAKSAADPFTDASTAEEVIEEMLCGEIQVGWRLTWAGSEPFRRYRNPKAKLRMTRTASSYSFVAPVGTILGLTPVTNAYLGEEREQLTKERSTVLNATQYAVHCIPERVPSDVAGGPAPD